MAHTDKTVASLIKRQQSISKRGLADQYNNTEACWSFYNGDMMTYEDRIQFMDPGGRRKRATVNFNKVQENVDSLVGFMAQNRRQAAYVARVRDSKEQNLYSRNENALYSYHRENMNADQIETSQDLDMVVCGYGGTETDLSYLVGGSTTTPGGEIIKMHLDTSRMGWDPNAKQANLLDAKWAYYFQDYELKDALDLFQGSSEEDFERVGADDSDDQGYIFNPYGGLYDKIKLHDTVEWTAKEQDMVRVYNHQWMEYETFYKAKNPMYAAETEEDARFMKLRLELIQNDIKSYAPIGVEAGDLFDFDPMAEEFTFDEATKRALVKEFGDLIEPVGFKRKCFYTAVISGEHVFSWFKSISQQGFSIKFKTGTYNEQGKFWIGMVNSMMEPAKYYNKAVTEFIFTVAALSKGGVMVEESAVEDIADFEGKWAKTDAVIKVLDGALSGGKIQEKGRAMLPNGIDTIITLADNAIRSNGVDPAFLGEAGAQESGVLYKRRIRQVISKFARYFDSITLYQKEDARLCADLMRIWVQNNEGTLVRIVGEDGLEQFREISNDMLVPEYDITIQEAPETPEDQMETAQVLGGYGDRIMPINPQAGQAFYAESLNLLNIDSDVRDRLIKILQPNQEEVPIAEYQKVVQQLQALQNALSQAQAAKVMADAKLAEAKAATESATQAEKLENAARTGLENDLVRAGKMDTVSVNI